MQLPGPTSSGEQKAFHIGEGEQLRPKAGSALQGPWRAAPMEGWDSLLAPSSVWTTIETDLRRIHALFTSHPRICQ